MTHTAEQIIAEAVKKMHADAWPIHYGIEIAAALRSHGIDIDHTYEGAEQDTGDVLFVRRPLEEAG